MKVYFGADHAGFELKQALIPYVESLGHEVEDCGAREFDAADDYPDFVFCAARKLASDVLADVDSRAIVIGASGQGEAMAANRVPGVRCALYYGGPSVHQTDSQGNELDMIESVREHNDANALSFGARFVTEADAKEVVKKWLETSFSGDERHMRRIQMLDTD